MLVDSRVCTHCRTRSASWLSPWRRGCLACLAFAGPRHPGPGPGPASPSRSWPCPNWRPAARRSAISRRSHSVQSFPSSALQQKKNFDTGQNRGEIYASSKRQIRLAGWLISCPREFSRRTRSLREKFYRIIRKKKNTLSHSLFDHPTAKRCGYLAIIFDLFIRRDDLSAYSMHHG